MAHQLFIITQARVISNTRQHQNCRTEKEKEERGKEKERNDRSTEGFQKSD